MLIAIICVFVFFAGLTYFTTKYNNSFYALFLFGTLLSLIPLAFNQSAPKSTFPYEAEVQLQGDNGKTTLTFQSFKQDNNIVTIAYYTTYALHWTDFKLYNIHDKELKIILTDNNNQFIYTERQSKNTIGKPNYATQ